MNNETSINKGQTTKRQAAVRLINTKDLDRETWLTFRKKGIGGSDAAAAMGISPYQSMLELWMDKTSRKPPESPESIIGQRAPMYWGNVLEPVIAEQYSLLTGRKVRRINAILQHPDEDKKWMLANLDFAIVGCEDTHILECKTAGEFGAKHWRDGVPDYVMSQVQHQLAVTGKQTADVCVLICGQELQIHRVERDDDLINSIIQLERHFWQYVMDDEPPAPDGSDSAQSALQQLYPRDSGQTLNWRGNPVHNEQFKQLVETRSKLDTLNHYEAQLKQLLQMSMGEATKAELLGGSVSWKRTKDSTVLDGAKLLAEEPKIHRKYSKPRAGSRRFTLTEKKNIH